MPEKQGKGRKKGILKTVFAVIGVLLAMAVIYVGAIMLQSPTDGTAGSFVVEDEPETVTRMQPAQFSDAQSLAAEFGAPLPVVPSLLIRGQAGNTTHDGQNVRVAALRYEGLVITAVRPVSAAPLLLRSELSVSLVSDLTVLNHPAVLAAKGGAKCVYFTGESAAYSVYTPQADEEAFLDVLKHMTWTK